MVGWGGGRGRGLQYAEMRAGGRRVGGSGGVVRGRGWKQNRTALTTEPKDRREDREDLQIEKACSGVGGLGSGGEEEGGWEAAM